MMRKSSNAWNIAPQGSFLVILSVLPWLYVAFDFIGNCRHGPSAEQEMYLSRLQPITPFQQILDNVTSDKRASHYGAFYSLYLDPLRRPQLTRGDDRIPVWENQEVNLLTVGRAYGDSLQLWERAFPRGVIYGIANDTTSSLMLQAAARDPRVRLMVGDQANGNFLQKAVSDIKNEMGLLDFIVDDGSHTIDQQQTSLKHLLPLVKAGFISFEAIVNQGTSDKRTHHYGAFYSLYLDPLRLPLQPQTPGDCQQPQAGEEDRSQYTQDAQDSPQQPWEPRAVNMLEIGLKYGDSLKLWKRAFPRGRIYGIDNEMISKPLSSPLSRFVSSPPLLFSCLSHTQPQSSPPLISSEAPGGGAGPLEAPGEGEGPTGAADGVSFLPPRHVQPMPMPHPLCLSWLQKHQAADGFPWPLLCAIPVPDLCPSPFHSAEAPGGGAGPAGAADGFSSPPPLARPRPTPISHPVHHSQKHQAEARDPRVRLMVGDQANGTFLEQVVAEIKSAVRSGGRDKECGEEWWLRSRVR
ncbi:unnamed protein product [Closterium sp. Naga37s-1]|nr:unnamed protein product [Closterium sp. Naga37s-1]